MSKYSDILSTVIENGRVLGNGDGTFDRASLEAEVEFEAGERGLSADETAEAVQFAIEHTECH